MYRFFKDKYKNIIKNMIPKNKAEAEKQLKNMNNFKTIVNYIDANPEYSNSDNFPLEGSKAVKDILVNPYIESLTNQYGLKNNDFTFDNPLDPYKEKLIEKGFENLQNGIHNAIEWGKSVQQNWPDIKQRTIQKIDDDLNIPRKYNDLIHGRTFGDIEVSNPIQKTDYYPDGTSNTTIYGGITSGEIPSNFRGFRNPLTNNDRIYTREDISEFTYPEFEKLEPEINAQWRKIGIPRRSDLELDRINSGGTVFVRGYTKSDGTYVKPHYRALN